MADHVWFTMFVQWKRVYDAGLKPGDTVRFYARVERYMKRVKTEDEDGWVDDYKLVRPLKIANLTHEADHLCHACHLKVTNETMGRIKSIRGMRAARRRKAEAKENAWCWEKTDPMADIPLREFFGALDQRSIEMYLTAMAP